MQNYVMPDSTLVAATETETADLAAKLAKLARPGDILLLSGPLGAGKSWFARAFIRARTGHQTLEVPSPTFTLVQSYQTTDVVIWHYDLWRLSGPDDLEELAWEEAQGGIILIEWPERLEEHRPHNALSIAFSPKGAYREITLQGEPRWFDAS